MSVVGNYIEVSLPAFPYSTSFGTLYLDPAACWWLTNAVTDGLGFWGIDYTIPASVPALTMRSTY